MAGISIRIDPLALDGVLKVMSPKSFRVYKTSWLEFTEFSGINLDRAPEEDDFTKFFESKRAAGLSGNTMKCLYSHLNKVFSCLYNQKIGVSDFSF